MPRDGGYSPGASIKARKVSAERSDPFGHTRVPASGSALTCWKRASSLSGSKAGPQSMGARSTTPVEPSSNRCHTMRSRSTAASFTSASWGREGGEISSSGYRGRLQTGPASSWWPQRGERTIRRLIEGTRPGGGRLVTRRCLRLGDPRVRPAAASHQQLDGSEAVKEAHVGVGPDPAEGRSLRWLVVDCDGHGPNVVTTGHVALPAAHECD